MWGVSLNQAIPKVAWHAGYSHVTYSGYLTQIMPHDQFQPRTWSLTSGHSGYSILIAENKPSWHIYSPFKFTTLSNSSIKMIKKRLWNFFFVKQSKNNHTWTNMVRHGSQNLSIILHIYHFTVYRDHKRVWYYHNELSSP